MSKPLVIVESPTKAKTISRYLGSSYSVIASYGHIKEITHRKDIAVRSGIKLHYQYVRRNSCYIEKIKEEAQKSDEIFLALDPDREGEAISWHIQELLKNSIKTNGKDIKRIFFREITESAVKNAIKNPRKICMDLVNAQQARSVLDLLVGFSLSPLLWKKIKLGLSAGRVQSPAMRLVIDRSKKSINFRCNEFWKINARVSIGKLELFVDLIEYNKKKVSKSYPLDRKCVNAILDSLSSTKFLRIKKTRCLHRSISSKPPFTTSTLQQECFSKLNFSTKTTMNIAQQLYEGVKISDSLTTGLVTYIRTDSTVISESAVVEIKNYIIEKYGDALIKIFQIKGLKKGKNVQEAHEAIRPTNIRITPCSIREVLTDKQFALYSLIWKRTVASQMVDARYSTLITDLQSKNTIFRARSSFMSKRGFSILYKTCKQKKKHFQTKIFSEGEIAVFHDIYAKQCYTKSLNELTEGGIVKSLENMGIGRPSTYSSIISTLKNRDYVNVRDRCFAATDTAYFVNKLLVRYFPKYIDYVFTADLESKLDQISNGVSSWITVVKDFWSDFSKRCCEADNILSKESIGIKLLQSKCRICGKCLVVRFGKFGRFISCSGYPSCAYTKTARNDQYTRLFGYSCGECNLGDFIRNK